MVSVERSDTGTTYQLELRYLFWWMVESLVFLADSDFNQDTLFIQKYDFFLLGLPLASMQLLLAQINC
jgi:hypothetical protein